MQTKRRSDRYRGISPGLSLIVLGWLFLPLPTSSIAASELVYVGTYEGVINPVAAEYINHVLTEAQENTAAQQAHTHHRARYPPIRSHKTPHAAAPAMEASEETIRKEVSCASRNPTASFA